MTLNRKTRSGSDLAVAQQLNCTAAKGSDLINKKHQRKAKHLSTIKKRQVGCSCSGQVATASCSAVECHLPTIRAARSDANEREFKSGQYWPCDPLDECWANCDLAPVLWQGLHEVIETQPQAPAVMKKRYRKQNCNCEQSVKDSLIIRPDHKQPKEAYHQDDDLRRHYIHQNCPDEKAVLALE